MRLYSFGNYPKLEPRHIRAIYSRDDMIDFDRLMPVLCYGQGRSYGDACLNENGTLLTTGLLNRFIAFDSTQGSITCEAGITFKDILELITPYGWFIPVVPGTQLLSLGGAIANDIHGKNHHHMGTLGRFVKRFELLRSDGKRYLCSPTEHPHLFSATIGGLGLTGMITWAEIALIPITCPYLTVETLPFRSLEEYISLEKSAQSTHAYTVAWLDASSTGRGVFMQANHTSRRLPFTGTNTQHYCVPRGFPGFILNQTSIQAFNHLFYYHHRKASEKIMHYQDYFFQLDKIKHWNRLYGTKGFLQYQCVLPHHPERAIGSILTTIARSSHRSFLSVLKTFGPLTSPGLLSFPSPGITLTLDFAFRGQKTLSLCHALDDIVCSHQGRIYLAKDARMPAHVFKHGYPNWSYFSSLKDKQFSSSLWRRVEH